jgi:HSF-type DNA-binding
MNHDIVDDSLQNGNDKDMTSQDAIFRSSLVSSSCPMHNTPINWSIKEQLLQELRNSLRMELNLDNPNQKWTEILATFDPHYSLLLERREFMLRTQALTALAHREAFQRIQDEESLFLTQLRRRIDHTNNLPLEIYVEQDDTLDKGRLEKPCKDENKYDRSQRDPTHTFPSILHEILSNPEYSEIITWLPHGRAWRIIRQKQFERLVIPLHFRHGRYSSFMRQV